MGRIVRPRLTARVVFKSNRTHDEVCNMVSRELLGGVPLILQEEQCCYSLQQPLLGFDCKLAKLGDALDEYLIVIDSSLSRYEGLSADQLEQVREDLEKRIARKGWNIEDDEEYGVTDFSEYLALVVEELPGVQLICSRERDNTGT